MDLFLLFLFSCCCYLQTEQKQELKQALAGLPAPKNDYEIVLPEQEEDDQSEEREQGFTQDQADIDANRENALAAERKIPVPTLCALEHYN